MELGFPGPFVHPPCEAASQSWRDPRGLRTVSTDNRGIQIALGYGSTTSQLAPALLPRSSTGWPLSISAFHPRSLVSPCPRPHTIRPPAPPPPPCGPNSRSLAARLSCHTIVSEQPFPQGAASAPHAPRTPDAFRAAALDNSQHVAPNLSPRLRLTPPVEMAQCSCRYP